MSRADQLDIGRRSNRSFGTGRTNIAECVLSSARSRMKRSRAMLRLGRVTRRWLVQTTRRVPNVRSQTMVSSLPAHSSWNSK